MADIWDFFASCAKLQIVFFFVFLLFFVLPETLPKKAREKKKKKKKKNDLELRARGEKSKIFVGISSKIPKKKNPIKDHQKIIIHKNKKKCQIQKIKKNPNNRKSKNLY